MRKKTHQEFVDEIFNLVGQEYSILGKYQNSRTKIKMRHNLCGYEWDVTPNNFFKGTRCPKCAINIIISKQVKSHKQFEQEVYNLESNNYTVLGKYINTHTKIQMKHNVCGHIWDIEPNSFIRGRRCPMCSHKQKIIKLSKSHEQFVNEIIALEKNNYSIIGKYVNSATKVKIKHNVCGHIWDVAPNLFIRGTRCPVCSQEQKSIKLSKSHEQFEQEVYNLESNNYTVLGTYQGANTKIRIKHNCDKCGNYKWEITPASFLSGSRCPKCNEFKGEKAIDTFLSNNHINYKIQYTFSDCKNKNPLRFDFAVFDENDNLKLLIEFQGKQHYEYVDFFHRDNEGFVKQILSDGKKRAYCEYNNIPLLEIYDKDIKNIETILKEKLLNIA